MRSRTSLLAIGVMVSWVAPIALADDDDRRDRRRERTFERRHHRDEDRCRAERRWLEDQRREDARRVSFDRHRYEESRRYDDRRRDETRYRAAMTRHPVWRVARRVGVHGPFALADSRFSILHPCPWPTFSASARPSSN